MIGKIFGFLGKGAHGLFSRVGSSPVGAAALGTAAGNALTRGAGAALGGAGGKYIGDNQLAANAAVILALLVQIIAIYFASSNPSANLVLNGFLAIIFTLLLLRGGKLVIGTMLVTIVIFTFGGMSIGFFTGLADVFTSGFTVNSFWDFLTQWGLFSLMTVFVLVFIHKFAKNILEVDYTIPMCFFFIAFVYPLVFGFEINAHFLDSTSLEVIAAILNFIYILPPWAMFIQLGGLAKPAGFVRWLQFIFIFLFMLAVIGKIIFVAYTGGLFLQVPGLDSNAPQLQDVWKNLWEFMVVGLVDGKDAAIRIYNESRVSFTSEFDRARGFETEVEQGATRDVGLTLGQLGINPDKPALDNSIIITSRLEAKAFDTEITGKASCRVQPPGRNTDPIEGRIAPEEFTIDNYKNTQLACEFAPGMMREQKAGFRAIVNVTFEYAASAYLRAYYLPKGKLSQLQYQRVSPEDAFFNYYGIAKQTASVFTKGPIEMTIGVPNIVQELSASPEPLILTFALEPYLAKFKGELNKINEFIFSLPQDFVVATKLDPITQEEEVDCTTGGIAKIAKLITPESCVTYNSNELKDLDCERYQHIVIKADENATQKVSKGAVFTCRVIPPRIDTDPIEYLPVTYRARVSYSYSISQEKSFAVKAPSDPLFVAQSGAALLDEVDGINIDTDVPYSYGVAFSNSVYKGNYGKINASLHNDTVFNAQSNFMKSLIYAHTLYYWNSFAARLSPGYPTAPDQYQIGNDGSPLRMNKLRYDFLLANNLIENDSVTRTIPGTTVNETIGIANMSVNDRNDYFRKYGLQYGVIYMEHLITECTVSDITDPACIFGKYMVCPDFDYNHPFSCGNELVQKHNDYKRQWAPKLITHFLDVACELDTGCEA